MLLTAGAVTPSIAAMSDSFTPDSRSALTLARFARSGVAPCGFTGCPILAAYIRRG